jgi:hypothetical protein
MSCDPLGQRMTQLVDLSLVGAALAVQWVR